MGATQRYKQAQQQTRVISNENGYLKGMYYTDVPLPEGYVKTLVNLDIDNMSGKLTPRPGLQSIGVASFVDKKLTPPAVADHNPLIMNSGRYTILGQSKLCGYNTTNQVVQSAVYHHCTVTYNQGTYVIFSSTEPNSEYYTLYLGDTERYAAPIPEKQIHGQKCVYTDLFRKPVGAFLNDQYFQFTSPNPYTTVTHLVYTKRGVDLLKSELDKKLEYIPEDINPELYYPCQSIPAQPSPSLAATQGFNMLLDDPYKFECKLAMIPTILGIIPYNEDGQPVLSPKLNDTVTLTAYYNAPSEYRSSEFQIKTYATTEQKNIQTNYETKYTLKDVSVENQTITNGTPAYRETSLLCNIAVEPNTTYRVKTNIAYTRIYFFRKKSTNATGTVYTYVSATTPKQGDHVFTVPQDCTLAYIAFTKADSSKITTEELTELNIAEKYSSKGTAELEEIFTAEELQAYVERVGIGTFSIGTYWCTTDADNNKTYYMIKYQYDHTKTAPELEKCLSIFDLENPSHKPTYSEKLSVIEIFSEDTILTETPVKIVWEWRQSTASDWQELDTETRKLSAGYNAETQTFEPFTINYTIANPEVMVRLRILDPAPEGEDLDIVLATQTIGISTTSDSEDTNVLAKKYDLAHCTGMCEWEQRLVLWGVPDALNTIFVSDINNPGYFPYPNNIDTFPDPVMGVYNYGDELIVLTTNSLYRLTWSTEGVGWTHTLVQRNLHITDADLPMNCVIKNMFLFKSGNQYYMMVPKAASTVKGETTIAPISKSIELLLENFHEEIYKITSLMKNDFNLPDFTKRLCYYHSFVDGNVVALNYVYDVDYTIPDDYFEGGIYIKKDSNKYFYVQLRYDTDTRTWSLRMFSTPYILQVPYVDAMGQGRYVLPTQGQDGEAYLQYCEFKDDADSVIQYKPSENDAIQHDAFVKNYQYIDTGNREIDTEHKKRFREFQFKIKNINATELAFYTGFYVDGAERKNIIKYKTDVNDENNEIIVTPVLDDAVSYNANGLFMPTVLGADDSKICWVVGDSAFPGRTLWKVRMPVSGKGYTPRVELLSLNEQRYEILGHSWVYRTMDAR
jgi:hypothetical protein